MKKWIVSNPDTTTYFYYSGGNTVRVCVKVKGVEQLEETIPFDTDKEAEEYFQKIN